MTRQEITYHSSNKQNTLQLLLKKYIMEPELAEYIMAI